ncbi:hypothetical protein BY996DRAFT_1027216 [Phakopsora pachyrhizi]|nr:hypothetical protein BY996DRAFT_1027216 [Phakopsora pachyrhizi]
MDQRSDGLTNQVGDGVEERSNQIMASIQTLEAIRDFSKDVLPLQNDGSNIFSWTCEIEEVLSNLIQCPMYFQQGKPEEVNPDSDRIAKKLIYWTIPRELRCCIRLSSSAHDAYESLKAQFSRNARTLHMAAFVELLNVRAEITEASDVTVLYNHIHSKYQELIHSGFRVNEDSILGVLLQMAIGRSTSLEVYNEINRFFDSRMLTGASEVSSLEVCSAGRSRLEIIKQSESYEEEIPATSPIELSRNTINLKDNHQTSSINLNPKRDMNDQTANSSQESSKKPHVQPKDAVTPSSDSKGKSVSHDIAPKNTEAQPQAAMISNLPGCSSQPTLTSQSKVSEPKVGLFSQPKTNEPRLHTPSSTEEPKPQLPLFSLSKSSQPSASNGKFSTSSNEKSKTQGSLKASAPKASDNPWIFSTQKPLPVPSAQK